MGIGQGGMIPIIFGQLLLKSAKSEYVESPVDCILCVCFVKHT
jgi:hypothetical protein